MRLPALFLLVTSLVVSMGLEQESYNLSKEKEDQMVIIGKENNDSKVNSVTKTGATNTTPSPSNSETTIRNGCPATQDGHSSFPEIQIPGLEPFQVHCHSDEDFGSGWMKAYFQHEESNRFNRTYKEYINEFGDLEMDWFMGLEKFHIVTNWKPHEAYIRDLTDIVNIMICANFVVGDKSEGYVLKKLDGCTGDISHFNLIQGTKFSTFDRDEDGNPNKNWAKEAGFGWWWPSSERTYIDNTRHLGIFIRRKD